MLRVRRRSPVFYQNLWGFAFAVPALILLIVFSVYPVLNALYIGFTSWSLSGKPEFIGLDNYITMFLRDPEFLRSLRTTAIYAVGLNPIMWAIALALALLFNREMRMRGIFSHHLLHSGSRLLGCDVHGLVPDISSLIWSERPYHALLRTTRDQAS